LLLHPTARSEMGLCSLRIFICPTRWPSHCTSFGAPGDWELIIFAAKHAAPLTWCWALVEETPTKSGIRAAQVPVVCSLFGQHNGLPLKSPCYVSGRGPRKLRRASGDIEARLECYLSYDFAFYHLVCPAAEKDPYSVVDANRLQAINKGSGNARLGGDPGWACRDSAGSQVGAEHRTLAHRVSNDVFSSSKRSYGH